VAVDAFVVRMTLVPAAMALMDRWAWWMPRWLGKVVPTLDLEGANLPATPELDEVVEPPVSVLA
jgi:RND superfamily putative drug exporter